MFSPLTYILKLVLQLLEHYMELHAEMTGNHNVVLDGVDITTEIEEATTLLTFLLSKFEDNFNQDPLSTSKLHVPLDGHIASLPFTNESEKKEKNK